MTLREKIAAEISRTNRRLSLLNRDYNNLHQMPKQRSRTGKKLLTQRVLVQATKVIQNDSQSKT